jgi:hypothetical protein
VRRLDAGAGMPLIQSSAVFVCLFAQVTSHLVEVGGADRGDDQELAGIFVSLEMIWSARMNYCE